MRRLDIVLAVMAVTLVGGSHVRAEMVEVAPDIRIEKKTFPGDDEEAPFYNFRIKTEKIRQDERKTIDLFLNKGIPRFQAAGMVGLAGWEAFQKGDLRKAALLFNEAYILEPRHSVSYHGFAAIADRRFNDLAYANELFEVAAHARTEQDTRCRSWSHSSQGSPFRGGQAAP